MKTLMQLSGLCVFLATSSAFGWGAVGHRTTGYIAESFLSPVARQAVTALLGKERLADVSTWADTIKQDASFKHMSWYHYENLADGARYLDAVARMPADQRQKGGVMEAILVAEKSLMDPTEALNDKTLALKSLVHFIGDLHQPMHSGRPNDKGGTAVPVVWFNRQSNLHSVWDTGMIYSGHADLFANQPANADWALIYARWLLAHQKPPTGEAIGGPEPWLLESMTARAPAYDGAVFKDQTAYQTNNLPVVDARVFLAGYRIAETLNRIFGRLPMPANEVQLYNSLERLVGRLDQLITLGPRASDGRVPPAEMFQ